MRDPQAADWGGLHWSEWHDFDEAHRGGLIPDTPGVYRFRAQDEPGTLLYVGETGQKGGRWARLDDLARGRNRHPPSYYLDWRAAGLSKRPHRGITLPVRPHVRGRRVSCRGLAGAGRAPG